MYKRQQSDGAIVGSAIVKICAAHGENCVPYVKDYEMCIRDSYKRIPICKELYADSYTPVEMMRILQKASHHCYLLESASQSEAWGRYSFLGYDPDVYKRQS